MTFMFRIAQLLELKYNLKSEGNSLSSLISNIKRDIINCYNLYINSNKAKDPVLQMLADRGEPFCKRLISLIEDIIANIDTYSFKTLLFKMNEVVEMIGEMKNSRSNSVRSFIHDSIRVTKESEKNYREHVKSKFEMNILRIFSIFEKSVKSIQRFKNYQIDDLKEYSFDPKRKELSKARIYRFIQNQSDIASLYGINDLDTFEKLLFYPDLKNKITTIINAVDRGQIPKDGPEVKKSITEIMEAFRLKSEKDNSQLFGEQKEQI
jgi:hypothetical protein